MRVMKFLFMIGITHLFISIYSSSYAAMRDISEIYYSIVNPCERLAYGSVFSKTLVPSMPMAKISNNSAAVSFIAPLNNSAEIISNKYTPHENFFIKLLTLYNQDSLMNLNSAYYAGIHNVPYSIILYDIKNNDSWYYGAKYCDAMSVILYGYAYIINTPKKILDEFDALLVKIDKTNGTIYEATVLNKLICTLDIFMHILSLLIEIPLALLNTFIGFFIGLIFHPWDSICSFLGFFYFAICSTGTAIFGLIADIFIVPYHLIF